MGRAYLAITIVTILWAINFTVAKIGTKYVDPLFIASFRIIVTGVVFYALLPAEERKIRRTDWKAILPLSLTGIATNHTCFALGISRTTPSHSAIIHALLPVVVGVVAWIVLRERQGPLAIGGMMVAIVGAVTVIMGPRRVDETKALSGDLISLLGISAFSLYIVYGRKAMQAMSPRRAVSLAFLFAIPIMVPVLVLGMLHQESWRAVPPAGWWSLVYMLVFANMAAYLLHSYALKHLQAGQVAAFTNLQPAIAIGVAILAGKDQLSWHLVTGSAIALVGVILVQLRR
jgi:drug/metabolite transporter (DMT)-like permease